MWAKPGYRHKVNINPPKTTWWQTVTLTPTTSMSAEEGRSLQPTPSVHFILWQLCTSSKALWPGVLALALLGSLNATSLSIPASLALELTGGHEVDLLTGLQSHLLFEFRLSSQSLHACVVLYWDTRGQAEHAWEPSLFMPRCGIAHDCIIMDTYIVETYFGIS